MSGVGGITQYLVRKCPLTSIRVYQHNFRSGIDVFHHEGWVKNLKREKDDIQ